MVRHNEHLALHDPLTGLPNRLLFSDRLEQALARARRDQQLVGVVMFDLDGFKAINDRHGHQAGDALLRQIGSRLAMTARDSDTVARFGGGNHTVSRDAQPPSRATPHTYGDERRPAPPDRPRDTRRPLRMGSAD